MTHAGAPEVEGLTFCLRVRVFDALFDEGYTFLTPSCPPPGPLLALSWPPPGPLLAPSWPPPGTPLALLVPSWRYNKFKGLCEPILNSYADEDFTVVTFRPATVCGYSRRLRLDLSVNILTNHAINNDLIKVFGGDQLRPNLHIQDYCDAVELLMNVPIEPQPCAWHLIKKALVLDV